MKLDVRRCAGPSKVLAPPINTSPFLVIYTTPSQLPLHFHSPSAWHLLRCAEFCCNMRWCLALLVCCFLAVVNALSSSGSRLLVVLDESVEKSAYSTLWSDLEGDFLFVSVIVSVC